MFLRGSGQSGISALAVATAAPAQARENPTQSPRWAHLHRSKPSRSKLKYPKLLKDSGMVAECLSWCNVMPDGHWRKCQLTTTQTSIPLPFADNTVSADYR